MQVEIWSDVMCPFCYIGKRKFEQALQEFSGKNEVEVIWKSFELNPTLVTDPETSIHTYLAKSKGWSVEQAKEASAYVTSMAKDVGLTYHMDRAVVANSMDAHRFSHFAKTKGKQDAAEERLFKAYFTEGKNTGDQQILSELGADIGLDQAEVLAMLQTDAFEKEVRLDEQEAQEIGVRGVPFFVFNRQFAVSGAQPSEVFLNALNKAAEATS